MSLGYSATARKRPVNLTLNEDLVSQVREVTDNLSSVVESLLAEFLVTKKQERAAKLQMVEATIAMWNQFADDGESFADDHSTL